MRLRLFSLIALLALAAPASAQTQPEPESVHLGSTYPTLAGLDTVRYDDASGAFSRATFPVTLERTDLYEVKKLALEIGPVLLNLPKGYLAVGRTAVGPTSLTLLSVGRDLPIKLTLGGTGPRHTGGRQVALAHAHLRLNPRTLADLLAGIERDDKTDVTTAGLDERDSLAWAAVQAIQTARLTVAFADSVTGAVQVPDTNLVLLDADSRLGDRYRALVQRTPPRILRSTTRLPALPRPPAEAEPRRRASTRRKP